MHDLSPHLDPLFGWPLDGYRSGSGGGANPVPYAVPLVEQLVNNAATTIVTPGGLAWPAGETMCGIAGLSSVLISGYPAGSFPVQGRFRVLVDPWLPSGSYPTVGAAPLATNPNAEICLIGLSNNLVWTSIQRGLEGTAASQHANGAVVVSILTQGALASIAPASGNWVAVPAGSYVRVQPGGMYAGDGTGGQITWQLPPIVSGMPAIWLAVIASPTSFVPGPSALIAPSGTDAVQDPTQQGVFGAAGANVSQPFGTVVCLKPDGASKRWIRVS